MIDVNVAFSLGNSFNNMDITVQIAGIEIVGHVGGASTNTYFIPWDELLKAHEQVKANIRAAIEQMQQSVREEN